MRSMTGYGRGESNLNNRKFVVEIRSVNHRFNDISVKLPRMMLSYEDIIKKTVSKQVFRGKTDVFVNFESQAAEDYKIGLNSALSDSYHSVLNEIKDRYGIEDKISLTLLSRFPDVITVEKANLDENTEVLEGLNEALSQAMTGFLEMRTREGENLKVDIKEKLEGMKETLAVIIERAPLVAAEYREKLRDRLSELEEIQADESRILTEAAVFADKCCIDEETTRLLSHLSQMSSILDEDGSIGRKLDFLVQEMNRESNTIASKSNDLVITNCTVELKSEIEKIREQVQNIE
ncbi:MAG: YicC family protein [Eubacterium sp.]|nr:YicC family protein [Eubacterium sp.]